MTPVSLIVLLCAMAGFGLAGFVFYRRHTHRLHFVFATLILLISLWMSAVFLLSTANDPFIVAIFGRLAFAFGAAIGSAYLAFTWVFPENYHLRPHRITVWCVAGSSMLMFLLSCTPLIQAEVRITDGFKEPVLGVLQPLYVIYLLLTISWGSYNLLRSLISTPSGRAQMQVKYSLTGFGLSFLMAFLFYFLLPFTSFRRDWWIIGGITPVFWILLTCYAIFRHRLMDIGVAFRNVLIQGAMAGLFTILFILPFILYELVLPGAPLATVVLAILSLTALLAIQLPRIQLLVTRFVDQRLFMGRYDHETALVQFGDELLRTYGRENIARMIAREIPIITQADGASVYLPQELSPDYILFGWSGLNDFNRPEILSGNHPLLAAVRQRQNRIIKEDIAYTTSTILERTTILKGFDDLHAALVFPLICQGRVLGIMFVGEKQQDNVFTTDDLKLISALASQAAFALDNTSLYEQVLDAKKHYETILQHMQRGVLAVDNRQQIIILNETGAAIFGMTANRWIGRPIAEMVPDFARSFEAALEHGHDQPVKELPVTMGNRTFPCETEISLLRDARNRVIGAMMVFQDLSEKKRFEQEVRRMDRLASVGTLVAGLAHEIKNPLVSIQTFIQLFPERYTDPDFRDKYGKVVQGEVSRINRLMQDLLEFARPRPRQSSLVNLHTVMDRALTLLEGEFRKNSVIVTSQYDPHVGCISGDSEQLYQVFFNLLNNALQAMDGPLRTISIITRLLGTESGATAGKRVIMEIRDTGKGIEEKDLPRIFDLFFSTKENGSGLGLSICHNILREHGAGVDVQSAPGQGTRFILTFPAETAGSI